MSDRLLKHPIEIREDGLLGVAKTYEELHSIILDGTVDYYCCLTPEGDEVKGPTTIALFSACELPGDGTDPEPDAPTLWAAEKVRGYSALRRLSIPLDETEERGLFGGNDHWVYVSCLFEFDELLPAVVATLEGKELPEDFAWSETSITP